jgi:hypothetical protein
MESACYGDIPYHARKNSDIILMFTYDDLAIFSDVITIESKTIYEESLV